MRFDDSLSTILSADTSSGFGASAAWRQLVDLMGRGRIATDGAALDRLRELRASVPVAVRAASARALAYARPGAALVGLFAEDELAIAAPVLRTATLAGDEWADMISHLSPQLRSVLRHRRDMPIEAERALASFGSVDFVIEGAPAASVAAAAPAPVEAPVAMPAPAPAPVEAPVAVEPVAAEPPVVAEPPAISPAAKAPLSETPFVALGEVARGLPLVAEALRRTEEVPPPAPSANGYAIADLVARIDAFQRRRAEPSNDPAEPAAPAERFRFETDAGGTVRWVDGVSRAALVGLSLATGTAQGGARVDGAVSGAFRRRSRFADARLEIAGAGDAAGSWRLSGVPVFDPDSGRFTGYLGSARRPRADEAATPASRPDADSLRQLVHELRTPANAIAGFAELIETELLGAVPQVYRERAGMIRAHAADLLAAIEDLDTAARIEGGALALRPGTVDVTALVARVMADLRPLVNLRRADLVADFDRGPVTVAGDERAVERLVGRLLAAVVAVAAPGERIALLANAVDGEVVIAIDRPAALDGSEGSDLLVLDGAPDSEEPGAPLLGTGFALRLARNLARELGGSLMLDADRLTLRLPAAVARGVDQPASL